MIFHVDIARVDLQRAEGLAAVDIELTEELQTLQTQVMHDRGWQSVDDIGKKVEEKIAIVVGRTMKTFYIDWLAKYGITAT